MLLSFINFKNTPEYIEIMGDKEGFEELIKILKYVIDEKEHFHLTEGNELNEYKICEEDIREGITSVKSIRIDYINT